MELPIKRFDGSGGKGLASGLNDPGFDPRLKKKKVKHIFYCFWLAALESMRSTSKYSMN